MPSTLPSCSSFFLYFFPILSFIPFIHLTQLTIVFSHLFNPHFTLFSYLSCACSGTFSLMSPHLSLFSNIMCSSFISYPSPVTYSATSGITIIIISSSIFDTLFPSGNTLHGMTMTEMPPRYSVYA